ncbi:MAG: TonB-dependent receptor family protein [Dysgonamonadaceae bacterium]|nr:TonB-dependent receptor family protein [Dysgonamonadaceae bacterium]
MQKLSLLTLLFFTGIISLQAQNFAIKGEVVDSLTNETIPYATVKVLAEESALPVKAGVSDENGKFKIEINQTGNFLLRIEFVGKKTVNIPFQAENGKTAGLGKISLADDSQVLGEVVVTAQKPLVKVDLDKITYSMEDDPDAKTNNVLEMLKKVPMVTVDGEENIQLKGSSNFKIYMNGKPSTLISSNPKDVLKSIPANTVKEIEVITDPGAKYDAEGVTGILNIITHSQSSLGGYTVSLNGGADHLGGFNAGTYFSVKYNKIGFTGNFNYYNRKSPEGENSSFREDFTNPGKHFLYQDGWSKNKGGGIFGYGELSYEIDTLNLVNISFNRYGGDNTGDTEQDVFMLNEARNDTAYSYKNLRKTKTGYGNTSAGIDYQRTFGVKDRLLTASYRMNLTPNDTESDNRIDGISNFDSSRNRQYSNGKTDEHTFQLDFTTPIAGIHTLESGLKYIRRINESNSEMSVLNGVDWIPLPSANDKFEHIQDILAAYAGYSLKYKKWGFKTGLRYEATWLNAQFPINIAQNFKTDYKNLVPSATVTYMLKPGQTFRTGYNMRIQRPGIWYLNPYKNTSDTMYISSGNPNLDAVKYHSMNLNYSFFNPKINLNFDMSYNFTNNGIEEITRIENSISYTNYENIARSRSLHFSGYANWTPSPKLRIYSNLGGLYTHLLSNSASNLKNSGWRGSIYGGAQYTLPLKIIFNLNAYLQTPEITLQGKGSSFYFYNFTLSKSFLKDNLNVRLYATNPFSKYLNFSHEQTVPGSFRFTSNNHYTMQRFGLSLSYRFGEMKEQIKKAQRSIQNDDNMSGGGGQGRAEGQP